MRSCNYKEDHSTETTVLKIQNDVLKTIDNQKCVFLVLLDMSAAFDTVDHGVLLNRLSDRIGIKGKALDWIASYLHERKQFVVIDGKKSIPQGSVLGPGMFSDYESPVGDIFCRQNIPFDLYAGLSCI